MSTQRKYKGVTKHDSGPKPFKAQVAGLRRSTVTPDASGQQGACDGTRNKLALLKVVLEMLGGQRLWEVFAMEIMPRLTLNPEFYRELSEAEYQFLLARVPEEFPVLMQFIRNHQGPPPPMSWLGAPKK